MSLVASVWFMGSGWKSKVYVLTINTHFHGTLPFLLSCYCGDITTLLILLGLRGTNEFFRIKFCSNESTFSMIKVLLTGMYSRD